MTTPGLEQVRADLAALRSRVARGEIDEATYDRLRERILADLTPGEREALGISGTPQPVTPGSSSPHPGTPTPVGPSGGSGGGARTALSRRARIDFEPGEVLFDQWRLERELGRGGFGVVFEATDHHLDQKQAVKVLDPKMVENADLLARFRREVLLMRRLVHPRIVRVFDYRESPQESLALLSMELVEGCSLRELKERAKTEGHSIPVPQALVLLQQILEALAAAHAQGVIHRDVSPGNILLGGGSAEELLSDPDRDPQVKLVDFGIAGLLERTELSAKSRALGTAAYVAPEVLDLAVDITPAVDVYGAGAVAYELLTGTLPLGHFREPATYRPEIPPEANDLVLELLETSPGDRPEAAQTARAVAELVGRSRAETERRAKVSGIEGELATALASREEARVQQLLTSLGSHLLPGERNETHARGQSWLAAEAKRREEEEAARRRQVEEERRRREADQKRLEEQRRQEAEAAAKERERRDAEERQRREATRRSEEEARRATAERQRQAERDRLAEEARRLREAASPPARAHPSMEAVSRNPARRGLSPAAWLGILALVAAVVGGIGWGVAQQREAERQRVAAAAERQRAADEAARREEAEKREAEAAETRRRQRIAETERSLTVAMDRGDEPQVTRLLGTLEAQLRAGESSPTRTRAAQWLEGRRAAPAPPRDTAGPAPAASSATSSRANPAGTEWVRIPGGTFTMGCTSGDTECHDDERPPHRVTIRSFELAATETTVGQYQTCVSAGRCSTVSSPGFSQDSSHSVVNVDWNEARSFCSWAGGRLPSEAEWEYAARGGQGGWKYPWGSSISHENANYSGTEGRDRWANTSPVKSFASNGYGLYDMAGNVWEWVEDTWHGNYNGAPSDGSAWTSGGNSSLRVLRGGSWGHAPGSLRVSGRGSSSPDYRSVSYGFRCARMGN